MKVKLRQLRWGILFIILLTLSHTASAFYDPTIGRFISRDPIGEEGGINLHAFVLNNPINGIDPLGETSLVDLEESAAIGADLETEGASQALGFYHKVKAAFDAYNDAQQLSSIVMKLEDEGELSADDALDILMIGAGHLSAGLKGPRSMTKLNMAEDLPGKGKVGWVKLKGNQGWKDSSGNMWKKDMLHKDHYDVMDRKGNKIKEIDFDGNQLWPFGPKNNNK